MRKTIELLAPAGDLARLKTAVRYGADAVYLGGKRFSLRSRASNFEIEDIAEGVRFAREYGAHVHVTVNIIPHEDDFDGLDDYLRQLERIGVHAVIVASPTIVRHARKPLRRSWRFISARRCPAPILRLSGFTNSWGRTGLCWPANARWIRSGRFAITAKSRLKRLSMAVCA